MMSVIIGVWYMETDFIINSLLLHCVLNQKILEYIITVCRRLLGMSGVKKQGQNKKNNKVNPPHVNPN